MRRKTFDAILATGGLVVAVILAVTGVLGLWAHNFVSHEVRTQLVQQQIYFPSQAAIAAQHNPDMTKYVTPYAGQQVTTGTQAQVFADHYIGNHLKEVAGGQTYSQVSNTFLTMKPTDPTYNAVSQQRQTLFMGETLRGLLLNAYAFGTMATIAGIAAVVAFVGAGLMLALSALGFWHLRRTGPDAVVLPGLTRAPANAGS